MLRRSLRIARNLFLMLIALCLALLVMIQIGQRMMRVDAERAYSDVMSLELLKTPGADAARIFSRWGNAVQTTGNCDSGNCTLTIRIFDWMARRKSLVQNRWLHEHYPMIGGRTMAVRAPGWIVNGGVVKKGFSL